MTEDQAYHTKIAATITDFLDYEWRWATPYEELAGRLVDEYPELTLREAEGLVRAWWNGRGE